MNFLSFSPLNYKIGLLKTLVDRIHKIVNTQAGVDEDIKQLILTLKRDYFPLHIIDNVIRKYKTKSTHLNNINKRDNNANDEKQTRYFKLPFIVFFF